MTRPGAALGVAVLCLARTDMAHAQVVPGEGSAIGTVSADRARLTQIIGGPAVPEVDSGATLGPRAIRPTVRLTWNSEIPATGGDGALWAGRGANAIASAGVWARRPVGRFSMEVRVEPDLAYSQNRPFLIVRGREPGRSGFSSPWHLAQASADLPLRFGDLPLVAVGPGQSSLTFATDRVAFGASTSNEWWGPAQRNTLVLSNNAAGIPRLFVRTARPVRTRFGAFEGRLMVGALTESPYFDSDASNDVRSVNGLLVTFRPALDTGLTLGLSRLVIAPTTTTLGRLLHFPDVFLRWERVAPESEPGTQHSDQIFSLFARWVFPESGFETYAEWARTELPRTLREYLVAPQHTQGYTLGLQWVSSPSAERHLRLRGEATYLEQTTVIPGRVPLDYYVGRAAIQGFTQRGQILGAPIGPGGSSQFLGADWIAPRWEAGAFVGRFRTENDALYRQFVPKSTQHDVSVQAGVRAGARLRSTDLAVELTASQRYNYLFESDFYHGNPVEAIDVRNLTMRAVLSPR